MAAFVLPELYKKSSLMNLIGAKKMLEKYKDLLIWKENASILEFGVGDGSNSQKALGPLLPKDYKEYIATDISKIMVDYARRNIVMPKCQFYEFDINCENIPSSFQSRFDYIFSFYVMMYVKKPEHTFKNIYAMLKPNGQTFNVFLPSLPTDPVHMKLCKHEKWGKYGHEQMLSAYSSELYPEKCYQQALDRSGFKYYFSVEKTSYTFLNEAEWKGFFLSVNTALANIPEDEVEEYKNIFLNLIDNQVLIDGSDRGTKTINFDLCVVSAKFGFGDGSNSQKNLRPLLPEDYKEYIATDLSKIMVDYARRNIVMPKCEFYEFDVNCEPIPSSFQSRFDYIFSFFTMMYVKKPEQTFKNIHAMLKPNGQTFNVFLLTIPTDPVHAMLCKHEKWGKCGHEQMLSPYSSRASPENCFRKVLERTGLNYYFSVEKTSYTFSNEAEWKGFFTSINTALPNIPDEELEEYKDVFLNLIENHVLIDGIDKGTKIMNFDICVVSASKISS
ncbi:unnamed protein product [Psylliodes chrysocephalus]|uniref:Juvenile hormone acid methyltransferase n=1 Tax=Psylliodes chrysocephalus TaxID=3402493 RepID=A0A9P0GG86_9CUCU|nr:unnamed protein product [Psylliodes chrysocephala]